MEPRSPEAAMAQEVPEPPWTFQGFVLDPSSASLSPSPQKDPENVDYEDLFLYSSALAEEVCSRMHDPWDPQRSSPCQGATPEEVCDLGEGREPRRHD